MPTATAKLPRRSRGKFLPSSLLGFDMAGTPIALNIGRLPASAYRRLGPAPERSGQRHSPA